MAFYGVFRVIFYALAWVHAVVLLGLTGYRIHWTRSNLSDYDPVIAELLVTSILVILFTPIAMFAALAARRSRAIALSGELLTNAIIWVMLLVGGAIATSKWPTRQICEAFPPVVPNVNVGLRTNDKQCNTLITINAFTWLTFTVTTLAGVFGLMQWAAEREARVATTVGRKEKIAPVAPATEPVTAPVVQGPATV